MSNKQAKKTEEKNVDPLSSFLQDTTTSTENLTVEEVKVAEFARADRLQVITLRDLLSVSAFEAVLGNVKEMTTSTKRLEDHKEVIKQQLRVALDMVELVRQTYDERYGIE
jgi:hypothetical protein